MEPQNSYVESALTETRGPRKSPVSRATEAYQAIMPAVAAGTIFGMSRTRVFTIILIVLVLGFAAFKLYPYIAYISSLVQLLRQLFGSAIGLAASTSTGIVDATAAGTDVIVDKLSGSSKKQLRLPEPNAPESKASEWTAPKKAEKAEKPVPSKPSAAKASIPALSAAKASAPAPSAPKKKSPEPDDTTSSVQSKSGYCYVGEWKGVRSCVKVSGECKSGKVFSTESACTSLA